MLSYGQIVAAIGAELKRAQGVKRVQANAEIGEGIPETPALHVYAESAEVDSAASGDMERSSFGAGVRQTRLVVAVDVYARVRSNMRDDMAAQMAAIDAVDAVLSACRSPFFGLQGGQGLAWRWERGVLPYGGQEYAGAKFTLTLTIY